MWWVENGLNKNMERKERTRSASSYFFQFEWATFKIHNSSRQHRASSSPSPRSSFSFIFLLLLFDMICTPLCWVEWQAFDLSLGVSVQLLLVCFVFVFVRLHWYLCCWGRDSNLKPAQVLARRQTHAQTYERGLRRRNRTKAALHINMASADRRSGRNDEKFDDY